MVELPSIDQGNWRFRPSTADIVIAICTLGLALFNVVRLLRVPDPDWLEITGTLLFALIVAGFAVYKAREAGKAEIKRLAFREHKTLGGLLDDMYKKMCRALDVTTNNSGLRIAIYKVHWDRSRSQPVELERITHYRGENSGTLGSTLSAKVGVIGVVARLGDPVFASRIAQSVDDFRSELIQSWGFSDHEAKEISSHRWSWYGIPLLDPDTEKPYGVVFLDSRKQGSFEMKMLERLRQVFVKRLPGFATGNTLLIKGDPMSAKTATQASGTDSGVQVISRQNAPLRVSRVRLSPKGRAGLSGRLSGTGKKK